MHWQYLQGEQQSWSQLPHGELKSTAHLHYHQRVEAGFFVPETGGLTLHTSDLASAIRKRTSTHICNNYILCISQVNSCCPSDKLDYFSTILIASCIAILITQNVYLNANMHE